ncbi:hypothetical protein SAMN06297422_102146 [Lachnospiraceae bacterium]|nr:hypothetical protein SAMN06297422_102146 [Lachnospiraceae bacterium]
MYNELSQLIMFRELGDDSILWNIADVIRDFESGSYDKTELVSRTYREIRRLLSLGTDFGFDKNLWHDYIAYVLVMNENPFSLTSERASIEEGSAGGFVLNDMKIFNRIFDYDFSVVEKELQIDCFSTITDYKAIHKRAQLFNKNVSARVRKLSDDMASAINSAKESGADDAELMAAESTLKLVTSFYRKHGVGSLGLNKVFRVSDASLENTADSIILSGGVLLKSISNTDETKLDDLIGYEIQKKKLRDNTEAFLDGKPANNVLLFGDAGTGKSTSIKALINEYSDRGLRMIELYKHQMRKLSTIISGLKNRNYKFIIYMDDLSFEEDETEYKYLKAVIEGGLETRPDNILIYATSNRRNLIRETWNDIKDVELDKHRSDTIQEKLSLVSRFGITIPYMKPNKKEYDEIVKVLAERAGITVPASGEAAEGTDADYSLEELLREANKWSVSHGGMTGRAAQQLIDNLIGHL